MLQRQSPEESVMRERLQIVNAEATNRGMIGTSATNQGIIGTSVATNRGRIGASVLTNLISIRVPDTPELQNNTQPPITDKDQPRRSARDWRHVDRYITGNQSYIAW